MVTRTATHKKENERRALLTDKNMLQAKDLMIGDWVTFKDCANDEIVPVRLFGIHNDEECCALVPGHLTDDGYGLDLLEIKNLAGIPLTPEILEKNGFYLNGSNEDGEMSVNIDYGKWCYENEDGFDVVGDGADIKYVHQLQHALRLCGIEKEITI